MNLVAYDKVKPSLNKQKTWIDVSHKRIISREINPRNYITFGKRYDKELQTSIFFIITLDNIPYDRHYYKSHVDDYGRLRIDVKSIWKDAGLCNIEDNTNITIKHIDSDNDGDIYELQI